MLFNSFEYLVFLPVVVLINWLLPARLRPVWLLVASYYFYMSWMKSYGLLLGGLTLFNYLCGLILFKAPEKFRRLIMIAGVTGNLGCLALYKYTDFFISTAFNGFKIAGTYPSAADVPLLNVILPLGISFFVFEFIHYLVDVRNGSQPIKSPLRFGLFAAFFPSQIAGPIKRYLDFDEQILSAPRFSAEQFESGIWLILKGLFKKISLGDNLAVLVQAGFETQHIGTVDAWIAAVAFALQIYFDFSGYTDIGRGSAMLLGYSLPENFNLPYLATSLREFWHRWHISLSTWLRDYLYIPLGGSHGGEARSLRNLVITMLLGGLWHGASWHFVAWGAIHGGGLAIERMFKHAPVRIALPESVKNPFNWALTMLFVLVGWIMFRADSIAQAFQFYNSMLIWHPSTNTSASLWELFLQSTLPYSLSLYCAIWLCLRELIRLKPIGKSIGPIPKIIPTPLRAAAILGLFFLCLGFASFKSMPFIYFQF